MSNVVGIKPGQAVPQAAIPDADVVAYLTEMLEMAKSGEIQGLVAAVMYRDERTGLFRCGATSLRVIGQLEEVKFRILREMNPE